MMTATQTQTQPAPARDALREQILDCLATFANQRPGMDPRDYGSYSDYRSESRSVTRDLHDFRTLLSAVRWRQSISADRLQAAFRAFSGRLVCKVDGSRVELSYCAGQYFPTEYRKAACAVLASALWDWMRDECMPAPVTCEDGHERYGDNRSGSLVSAGDWLRRAFRREFGARLARRWFS